MKQSEKIISAIVTVALGVLLIVLRSDFISILLTIGGIALIALGAIDLFNRLVPPAVVKIVAGGLIIFCGWVVVQAALYVLAAALLIAGILLLYDKVKNKVRCRTLLYTILDYASCALLIVVGFLLLFNQGNTVDWVLIVSGILTVAEGSILLVGAFSQD